MNKLEGMLVKLANGLSENKVLTGISHGLMSSMGVLFVGSMASLLLSLPIGPYQSFINSTGIRNIFVTLVNVTTNLTAIYALFGITYTFVKGQGKNGFTASIIALVSFFAITPMETIGEGYEASIHLPLDWLGPRGLVAAMIVAIVVGILYPKLVDRKIEIKMPESVPPFVASSFEMIIPASIIIAGFAVVGFLLSLTPLQNLHVAIYILVGAPLSFLGSSVWVAILVFLLSSVCWFFGIHGIAVMTVALPLWMGADGANVAAIAQGLPPQNILTFSWIGAVSNIGGAGATMGLVILCAFFAKSERYRKFGKLALVPSLFNINEPVVFGMPCVLNPTLAIPFIITQPLLILLAYLLTKVGILPIGNGVGAPAGVPLVLSGAFTGGFRLVIWQAVAIGISIAMYLPFFRILDKQAVLEESAQ